MPVRFRQGVTIGVSSTSAEEKDLGNLKWEVVTDDLGEGGSWKTLVEAGEIDLEIALDNLAAAKFLALRTVSKDPTQNPVALTFKKESALGEPFVVQPLAGTKEGHFMISTDAITALFVTNSGVVDMEVTIVTAGD